jgi:hypothetical protein
LDFIIKTFFGVTKLSSKLIVPIALKYKAGWALGFKSAISIQEFCSNIKTSAYVSRISRLFAPG